MKKLVEIRSSFYLHHIFLLVFMIFGLNNCSSDKKSGIEGDNNQNNSMIIADNIETAIIENSSKHLTEIPDGFNTNIKIGMNPELIKELLGPPHEKSKSHAFESVLDEEYNDYFHKYPEQDMEIESWIYSYKDIDLQFHIFDDGLLAYSYQVIDPDSYFAENARQFKLNFYCDEVILGETTFGDLTKHASVEFIQTENFGTSALPIIRGKYFYPRACTGMGGGLGGYIFVGTILGKDKVKNRDWSTIVNFTTGLNLEDVEHTAIHCITVSRIDMETHGYGMIKHFEGF